MSAFGGICSWDRQPVLDDSLSVLAAHLHVGGPNRSGTVRPAPWLALQAHVLHFDRLSAGERQPYPFARGSVLTWDGRLDNREDLLLSLHRDLGPDDSDAALVAGAYERWGMNALPRLIGDWCLAIWDAPQQHVILARDYLGNRPLYYRHESGRLVWATRLEALAACENLFDAPDDVYIAGALTGVGASYDSTPFRGASTLLAGHVLIGTRDDTTIRRYWKYLPTTLRCSGLNEYADHLRMLVTEGVRLRLRSTRTVWAHLSGGWDSSAVVCVAQRLIDRKLVEAPAVRPLSLVPRDAEADEERAFIAAVERWCGLETTPRPYRGPLAFAELLGYRAPMPMPNYDMFDMDTPIQAAGDQIVLTGELGDLTMGRAAGPVPALWEPFDSGRFMEGLRGFVAYAHIMKQPVVPMLLRALRHRFRPYQPASQRKSHLRLVPDKEGVQPELLLRAQARWCVTHPSSAEFPRTHQPFVNFLYELGDRGGHRSPEHHTPAIWRTHPYSHRPLIEFLLAVPSQALFDPLFERIAMRRALVDILPPAILQRSTKVGVLDSPLHRSRRRQAELMRSSPPITEPVTEWHLVQRGIVEPKSLANHVAIMRSGSDPSVFLYRCVCTEAWLRSLTASTSYCSGHRLDVMAGNDAAKERVGDARLQWHAARGGGI